MITTSSLVLRRTARTSSTGDLILLEDQDRSRWNQDYIAEGKVLVQRALSSQKFGSYTLQAAITAVHSEAASVTATDWAQIVALYDVLLQVNRSPIVGLNRAVAMAMRDGALAGLQQIEVILAQGNLSGYHPEIRQSAGKRPAEKAITSCISI